MRFAQFALVHLLAAMCFTACASTGITTTTGELVNRPAPDFSLASTNGQKISLAQFRGKIVILDFWATWCPPCRESLPHLQQLAADPAMQSAGLVVLAVNELESAKTVQAFLAQIQFRPAALLDANGSTARAYAVDAIPTTFIVGRDGKVLQVISGFTSDTPHELDDALGRALAGPATAPAALP